MEALAVLGAYLIGAVPFSQIVSLWRVGVDLREVGTGTVSGTGLYRVAGIPALVLGGGLDVAKGALAAALAGGNPTVGVFAAAAVIIGHCWSIFLRGAGGRGLSPAIGALAVLYWPGALMLLAALAIGRLVKETGLITFIADVVLLVVLAMTNGSWGMALGLAIVIPMLLKRLLGNACAPDGGRLKLYRNRLLYDADQHKAS
jgi:glycerol-3-phosphate acyltransferase PlsY